VEHVKEMKRELLNKDEPLEGIFRDERKKHSNWAVIKI
jgi:hypothetical protein